MKFALLNGIQYKRSIHRYTDIGRKRGRKISNVWAYDKIFNRKRTITNQSKNNKFKYCAKTERNFYRLHKRSYSNTTLDHISYKSDSNQEELQI